MSPTLAGAVVWLEASGRGPAAALLLAVDGGAVADDDAAAAVGFGSLNQSRRRAAAPTNVCLAPKWLTGRRAGPGRLKRRRRRGLVEQARGA